MVSWEYLYRQISEDREFRKKVDRKLDKLGIKSKSSLDKDLYELYSGNCFKKLPPLDTIVTLDPRGDVLARVEDSILQWLQVIGIFLATSFVIVSLVDNGKRRKWYSIIFLAMTIIISGIVFHQFVRFRNELKNLNIEEPLRMDVLLIAILLGTVLIAIITIDHGFSDITIKG